MARRRGSRSGAVSTAAGSKPTGALSPEDRILVIETALELLETLYVHLPLKRSMYAVNPLQRLKLLRRRCEQQTPMMADQQFFNELLSIFCQLRDRHTTFVLPEPFRSSTAFLPFRLERCVTDSSGKESYVVTQLISGRRIDPSFRVGSIVTHWNGTPISRVVAANADREAGSNPAARRAQGLSALTIRWLGQSVLPDEEWIDIRYLPEPGKKAKQIRFEWNVFRRQQTEGGVAAATAITRAQRKNIAAVGMDARGEAERQIRRHLFKGGRKQVPRLKDFGEGLHGVSKWAQEVFPTCGNVRTSSGVFAYVRIATFNVDDDKKYLNEFIRIISKLRQSGLILDVRGNGGGLIAFGERMLQLLTPRVIDPARFSFLNSARTQALTAGHEFIRQWRDSIAQWVETGAEYSQGFPLLALSRYNDIGQKYQGPVVLITDALCYSTTDIFAAGFQDHKIGVVLGVDETTGAGGANVWDYSFIAELLDDGQRFPRPAPESASLRFAVRRVTRVGENSGVLLEDLGVKVDELHKMTQQDLLKRNIDLIEHAGKILAKGQVQRLTAERESSRKVRIGYQNLDRIDAYLNDRPLQKSLSVKRSKRVAQRLLSISGNVSATGRRQLHLEGFRHNPQGRAELVAATRLVL